MIHSSVAFLLAWVVRVETSTNERPCTMRELFFLGLLASVHGHTFSFVNKQNKTNEAAAENLARSVLAAVTGVLVNALFDNPPDLESEFTKIRFF